MTKAKISTLTNPFPGLRPFTREESHLFFGREGQIDNVSENLIKNRFVAVIGSSGSGKSSLIYCGVLSRITKKGNWKLAVSRPGSDPLMNLYTSVYEALNPGSGMNESLESIEFHDEISGLLKKDHAKTNAEYLIVIDQFEEIFRYRLANDKDSSMLVRSDYANFLVELVEQQKIPVNIIITMRSDFIGECSRFQNFTSLINRSNYLIPRMSRDNFRRVIEEPVRIAGAGIEADLVEKILEEMGDNQDQLPILQHALMRTWNYWKENSPPDKPVSLNDYLSVGGISRALSDHANEAYDELDSTEKTGCEKIFRSLTEKGMDNRGVRRPTSISKLARIAELNESSIEKIVNIFRADGRSFLTPSYHVPLNSNTVVDLSHEALMRIWDRLSNWVDEEAAAVTMYKRLSETAALYQTGKSGLWRPPDLQLAINWKTKNKPNLAWAERHDPAFERTMVFLNTSQEEYEKEEANKLRLQKLRLRRTRTFAIVLGTAAIISLVMFLWTRQLSVDLEQQIVIAENERNLAQQKTVEAEEQRQLAQLRLEEAEVERNRADTAAVIAEERRLEAETNARIAANQTALAKTNLNEANRQSLIALENAKVAEIRKKEAEEASMEAFTRRMLSISNSMAVKSAQINSDSNLKSLLALQAFLFNKEYKGNFNDPDIYIGLYDAVKSLLGNNYNQFKAHTNAVRSVRFLPETSSFFSSGSDGRILKWNLNASNTEYASIVEGRNVIDKLAVSSDGKFLLASEDRNGLFYVDLASGKFNTTKMTGEESTIRTMSLSEDNSMAFTAGLGNFIEKWDIRRKTSVKFIETDSRINSLSVNPNATILAAGTKDGKTIIWQIGGEKVSNVIFTDPVNNVQTISFSPDGKLLVCGTLNGEIRIFNADNFEIIAALTGHVARITEIGFSPDSKKMASTSYDGKVLFWDMTDFTNPPITFSDNQGFGFTVAFSSDGNYFVSGSAEEARLVSRAVSSEFLADKICPLISRNLSEEEWNLYVGGDIEYEKTCGDK